MVPAPSSPVPRRKVTIAAPVARPRPQANGTSAATISAAGTIPPGSKCRPNTSAIAPIISVARSGTISSVEATEPICTVAVAVGVASSDSSVPCSCSWRIAPATRYSSTPSARLSTIPVATNSR